MNDQKRFIGIDMSKRSFEVAVVNNADPQILRKKYKATHEDRQEFISSLRKDDVVALETGNSSFILAKLIKKQVCCFLQSITCQRTCLSLTLIIINYQ